MDRRGRISIVNVLLILVLIAGGVLVYTFAPPYLDYFRMKEVSQSAVLEWRAWDSLPRAEERLEMEFRRKSIPDYIYLSDCRFSESQGIKTVACDWYVDVYYPHTEHYQRLEFHTEASADAEGLIK